MNNYATTCCGKIYEDHRETNIWSGVCPNPDCAKEFTGFMKI